MFLGQSELKWEKITCLTKVTFAFSTSPIDCHRHLRVKASSYPAVINPVTVIYMYILLLDHNCPYHFHPHNDYDGALDVCIIIIIIIIAVVIMIMIMTMIMLP